MAISTYLPIITLNVNGLNILNERHRASVSVDEETSPIDVLPTGDSLETLGQTEHEEMEKPGQRKWKPEESVRSYGRQNGLSNKGCHTTHSRALRDDEVNPTRERNVHKYLRTRHRNTETYEVNSDSPKGRNRRCYNNRRGL